MMKAYSWITCVLGLWLMVAAFVFTYSTGMNSTTIQEVVLGAVIFVLGGWDGLMRPNSILSWLIALAGLITLAAPIWVGYSGVSAFARGNDVVVGLVVLMLGCASAFTQHRATHRIRA